MLVRDLQPEDVESVAVLLREINDERDEDGFAEFLRNDGRVLVADGGSGIAGVCSVFVRRFGPMEPLSGWIGDMVVNASQRRHGVARLLLAEATAWARAAGARWIALHTHPEQYAAVALYISAGFELHDHYLRLQL